MNVSCHLGRSVFGMQRVCVLLPAQWTTQYGSERPFGSIAAIPRASTTVSSTSACCSRTGSYSCTAAAIRSSSRAGSPAAAPTSRYVPCAAACSFSSHAAVSAALSEQQ